MPVKKNPQQTKKQTAPAKPPKRQTAHVFDLLLKQLLHLSNKAVISFINGIFNKKYPMDSTVEFLSTETVSKKLRSLMSDTRVNINNDTYIIEGQIRFDGEMMIRVFEYGYYSGLTDKTFENGIRTVKIAPAIVIYWQGAASTPEKQTLRLKFPDGFSHTYEVETFTPLTHRVKELEKKGLAILLPFYVLKLRKQIERAKTSAERKKLSGEMQTLLDELIETVDNCKRKGTIEDADIPDILGGLERLFKELYGKYKEFVEDDSMLKDRLDFYLDERIGRIEEQKSLKIAKNMLALGLSPEKVAQAAELPLAKVKALLKTAKVKLPA
jgi:predicted transposase/invertase (TIGR01784 family)